MPYFEEELELYELLDLDAEGEEEADDDIDGYHRQDSNRVELLVLNL